MLASASSFVGRGADLAALARLVGRERVVTVVGPGGCGKTRLTLEALRAATGPVHGFVELAAAGPATGLARVALSACAVPEDPTRAAAEQLRAHLAEREGLLVLDNCEHLRREVAAFVDELLRRCPRLRVLATSRVSLGVAGESVLPLVGLDPTGDAVTLFLDRARRVQPDLPSDGDALVGEICVLADGLPLAVELAAAHARTLPLADIRDGMADRMRFLAARDPAGLPRHSSLASSLDWSVGLVGEPARRALAALSVVDGRFPTEVALALSDRAALETLVDHSLVQFDAIEGRYLLLDTVREYAARLLAASGTGEAAHRRLLGWAVGFAREVRHGLERAAPDVLRRVDAADAAVASAMAWTVVAGRERAAAADVAVDLAFAWSLRGRCAEGLARVRRLAAVLDPVPPALRWAEAFLTGYAGDMETAVGIASEVAATAEDDRTRARALTLVGMVLEFVDPVGAEPVLAEATELAARAADDWCVAEAFQILAYCRVMRADLPGAAAAVDAAVPALARLGHAQLRAWDAALRAEVAVARGGFAAAEAAGREGLRLAVAVGEPVSATGALFPLVRALVATGRIAAARAVVEEHREFFATHPGLAVAEAVLVVEASAGLGPPATALAATAAAQLWWPAGEAADLLALARLADGDPAGALAALAEVAAHAERLGHRGTACRLGITRAAALRALRDGSSADVASEGGGPVGTVSGDGGPVGTGSGGSAVGTASGGGPVGTAPGGGGLVGTASGGGPADTAPACGGPGDAARAAPRDPDAAEVAHAALAEAATLGLLPVVVDGLELVAALAADSGRPVVAARLQGAAGRVRAELGAVPSALTRLMGLALPDGPEVAAGRAEGARLVRVAPPDGPGKAKGWAEGARPASPYGSDASATRTEGAQAALLGGPGVGTGARLDVDRAVAYAARARGRRARPRTGWESLTPTEGEVVALATRGLSNAAIGRELLVSQGTVRTHLRSVFGKLGVTSRAELAARAARRGM